MDFFLPRRKAAPWVALLVSLLAVIALAAIRTSSSFIIANDEVAAGGGASASASFAETTSAAGQAGGPGLSHSTTYKNWGGVVQSVPDSGFTAVNDWRELDPE